MLKIVLDTPVKNGLKWWVVIDGKEWYLICDSGKGLCTMGEEQKRLFPLFYSRL